MPSVTVTVPGWMLLRVQPAGTVGSVIVHSRPVGMFPVTLTQPLPSFSATSWS